MAAVVVSHSHSLRPRRAEGVALGRLFQIQRNNSADTTVIWRRS